MQKPFGPENWPTHTPNCRDRPCAGARSRGFRSGTLSARPRRTQRLHQTTSPAPQGAAPPTDRPHGLCLSQQDTDHLPFFASCGKEKKAERWHRALLILCLFGAPCCPLKPAVVLRFCPRNSAPPGQNPKGMLPLHNPLNHQRPGCRTISISETVPHFNHLLLFAAIQEWTCKPLLPNPHQFPKDRQIFFPITHC